MKAEYSGNIYRFQLEFIEGYAYAEILDYSDFSSFDGIMIQVYNLIDSDNNISRSVEEIVSSGLKFGPVPIVKYPNIKGKDAWKLIGKNKNHVTTLPEFKDYMGSLSIKDWSKLHPWRKTDILTNESDRTELLYEEVRNLETLILNHPEGVRKKITMIKFIEEGISADKFYDMNDLGTRNIYVQVVNTYYDKSKTDELLKTLD